MAPTPDPTAIRKAAILFRSLEPETAASLLARLSPTEARSIRAAIRALGPLDDAEQAAVTSEFCDRRQQSPAPATGGVELELSQPQVLSGRTFARLQSDASAVAADHLADATSDDVPAIVAWVTVQPPRIAAVVINWLSPDLAADVLAGLSESQQAAYVAELAELGEIHDAAAQVIADEIDRHVTAARHQRRRAAEQQHRLSAILAAAKPDQRLRLQSRMAPPAGEERRPPATRRPESEMSLARLDAAAWRRAWDQCGAETIALALCGVAESGVRGVEASLTTDEMQQLHTALYAAGARTALEVETARRDVLQAGGAPASDAPTESAA